jgi:cytochrome P450
MGVTEAATPLRLTTEFIQNPYPVYDMLRGRGPASEVIMPRGVKVWLVTRYEDARVVLADTSAVSKDASGFGDLFARHSTSDDTRTGLGESLAQHMLNSDPPDHTRLRNLVNKAFTARTVERLRPRIEQITTELLDDMAAAGDQVIDLLDAFAFPLPITVICELLGVPQTDRDDFRAWSNTLLSSGGGETVGQAALAMANYLSALIARKRADPGDDMLTGLIDASDSGDRLTEIELVSMAFLLLVAGHETTVNLIGNGVLALLRNPDQFNLLRGDPSLLPGAIEEFLRFESPVNLATLRYTKSPLRLGEMEIPAGEFVLVSLGSANRDGGRFGEPDRLDVTRKSAGHAAFGHGIHYCLGAPLARLEGQIAIGHLIERFPKLTLAAEPAELTWRESTIIRGLLELPVTLV